MKQTVIATIASWTILLIFIVSTQPNKLPVIWLVLPFVLLYVALLQTWHCLWKLYHRFITKQPVRRAPKQLAITVCASFIALLILQSLGQLMPRDVITIITIAVIGYVYATRNYFGGANGK